MSDKPSLLRRIDGTHVPMLLARLILGNLFIYYGLHKIGDPIDFLKQIKEYNLLPLEPPALINITAVAMPWIEILCGNLLIAGLWIRGSALTILGMLVMFTVAIFVRTIGVYQEGGQSFCDIAFDCGCGSGVIVICNKLAINTSMIVLAAVALWSRSRFLAMDKPAATAVEEPEEPEVKGSEAEPT